MTDSVQIFPPGFRVLDSAGDPVSGAKIKFFEGGTSTPKNVYSDKDLGSSLGSIVYTRSDGFPVASSGSSTTVAVYTGTALYDVIITDANDVTIYPLKQNQKGALDTSTFLSSSSTSTLSIPAVTTSSAARDLAVADRGKVLSCNTGSNNITLTLLAAATLGDGWNMEVRKASSSNTLTIQTTGGEFINETLTSLSLVNKDDFVAIRCNGVGFVIGAAKISTVEPYARNLSLLASVGSNILTIAIKTQAGLDPTTDNPVRIPFRNVTPASGDFTVIDVTAATSLAVTAGSTLGTSSAVACKLWVVAFNDGSTLRLGVINCLSSLNIYPLGQFPVASSTAEGAAGGADTAHVFYTGTAVTSKAYTILGYLSFESGQSTAGNWSVAPTRVEIFGPHTPLPGTAIQTPINASGAVATTTTAVPNDDTIPQNTEGGELLTRAITPTSAAHVLRIEAVLNIAHSASVAVTGALLQDSVTNALAAGGVFSDGVGNIYQIVISHRMLAATSSSTTFKVRAGGTTGATLTFNGSAGGRLLGGVLGSFLQVTELAA